MAEIIPLTEDELVDLLIEECAEVIKAAMKCKRFGYDRTYAGYGNNVTVLAEEMGDVRAVIYEILERHPELKPVEEKTRTHKIQKATRVKNENDPINSLNKLAAEIEDFCNKEKGK